MILFNTRVVNPLTETLTFLKFIFPANFNFILETLKTGRTKGRSLGRTYIENRRSPFPGTFG